MIALRLLSLLGVMTQLVIALPAEVPRDIAADDAAFIDYLNNADPSLMTITPGPGLPTLEELGYTAADYLDPDWRAAHGLYDPRRSGTSAVPRSPLVQKRSGTCYPNGPYGNQNGAYQCRDYLNSLGKKACKASGGLVLTTMCTASYNTITTVVLGMPAYPLIHAESYCQDVALAVNWVIDHCSCPVSGWTCQLGGYQAANGNGNLLIYTRGTN